MAEKPGTEATEKPPVSGNRRRNLMMVGVLVGVMCVEGAVVFVLAKKFGAAPQSLEAAGPGGLSEGEGEPKPAEREVEIVKFRAQNDRSPRPVMYELSVYARVPETHAEAFTKLVEERRFTVQDRFAGIVRAADPQRFQEPDLATLRQDFREALRKVVDDEKLEIKEVLIPTIVPYTEF